jgi:hypothetical protein
VNLIECWRRRCPDCHTAFDWNTGRVATGVIHNPHYYDFQRQHGRLARNPGDVPCGGMPDIAEINVMFGARRYDRPTSEVGVLFYCAHRLVSHVMYVELQRYAAPPRNTTLDMRVQYLMNEITEDRFKQKLQQIEKRREKRRDIFDILTMFSHTATDTFRQLVQDRSQANELAKIMIELRTYTNQTFQKIQGRYGGVAPSISETWEIN